MKEQYVTINKEQIPLVIKSYKTSKSVKIFFKNDKITITKPIRLSNKNLDAIIKQNEEFIYNTYFDEIKKSNANKRYWKTGEKIFFKGEEFEITREVTEEKQVNVYIKEDEKKIRIMAPNNLSEEDIKDRVDRGIKELYKKNTFILIQERLPYWKGITGITYNNFIVRDAKTKYGSCNFKTKILHFSSRLIMLPEEIIDAVIVHELCHIMHPNHSKDFYNLVESYIKNYKQLDKWLNKNSKIIVI